MDFDKNLVKVCDLKKGETYFLPGDYFGLLNESVKIKSVDKIGRRFEAIGVLNNRREVLITTSLFKEKFEDKHD